jgi:hypothetical protein
LEIALNLVWLGVSLGLVVFFGVQAAPVAERRRRGMAAAVALVCLVCFLFPVISMTDDLYSSGPAMLEPSKLKKLVVSTQVVLTLLPWIALQKPQEDTWAPLGLPPADIRRPLQDVLAFDMSRRPPPSRPALA